MFVRTYIILVRICSKAYSISHDNMLMCIVCEALYLLQQTLSQDSLLWATIVLRGRLKMSTFSWVYTKSTLFQTPSRLPLKCTDQHFHECTQRVHFFRPLPLSLSSAQTNIFGFQNKGLTQHNIYCVTTKINPSSEPAMWQMIPLAVYYELQITVNIVHF